jgi:hypothetical protein
VRCNSEHFAPRQTKRADVFPGLLLPIASDYSNVPSNAATTSPTGGFDQLTETSRNSSISTSAETIDEPYQDVLMLALPNRQVARLNLAAYGLRSSQEADLLRHSSQNLFPSLISSHAHPGFQQQRLRLSNLSEPRPLVDALLAVSSLYLSNKSTYYDERAVGYYSNSLHDLGQQVGDRSISGVEDHLLMNVVWLYIFEVRLLDVVMQYCA